VTLIHLPRFGYVVTAGRVTCLLDFSRACLRLSDPPSRRIANRRKDVARCLRLHGSLAEKASFRVSTSFQQALVKLKRHHQHSWVGAELEALWGVMLEQRKLEVLELWVGDRLVAADFAHPVGKVTVTPKHPRLTRHSRRRKPFQESLCTPTEILKSQSAAIQIAYSQ
jgi:hypothetical protein